VPVCPQCASENPLFARFCGFCGGRLLELEPVSGPEAPEEDPWLGRVVDRRYRVLSRVGSGGMGLVYKVEHIQLGKIAAMKVLHADTARDAEAVRRFRTEAQAVSRLDHPNIVHTFDFGQSDGSLYLIMEYLKGDDLATVIKRDGPLSFEQAAHLFVQVCSALTEAHESGVIHRDLKPENIFVVSRRGGAVHAKVLDFGLAKLRKSADGPEITAGGQVIGTPYYMSPEQVLSESIDHRTDIYSLGATLYRVLTGTPPFQAATPVGVLTKHVTDPLEPPSTRAPELNLPPEVDAIVTRAMAKSPDDRYATAADVQRELEAALWKMHWPTAASTDPEALKVARLAHRHSATADAPTLVAEKVPHRPIAELEPSDGDVDATSGDRLRKEDFDAFTQSLRRRRILSLVLPALLVVAAGGGLWAYSRAAEKGSPVEREPNNTPGQATLLPLDAPVLGTVGRQLGDGHPDMDYFRVPGGKGIRVVSARLDGIPDVDLVLELFDAQGRALAKSDSHGGGSGEWLQPVAVGPGEAYILIRQVWIQGAAPVESVGEPYRLTVHWGPLAPGWEIEPNDDVRRATVVEPGQVIRGYLSSAEDRDWFAYQLDTGATGGRLVGMVKPPDEVDIVVAIDDGSDSSRRKPTRTTESHQIDVPITAGQRLFIGLARRSPVGGEMRDWRLVGLDAPYELKLELRAGPK
jgi:serine/threonine protein kinase